MFKVKIRKKKWVELEVTFTHRNPNGKGNVSDPLTQLPFGTECQIYFRDGSGIGEGYAFLHPLDWSSYCKETGRKIALRRVLENLHMTKPQRTKIWKAYFAAQNEARELALTQGMIAL